jgi:uncharacterized protein YndB with AHSA1/START domain
MPQITVQTTVNAPIEKVWEYWTAPEHITQWNQASPDWHCPAATNDLKVGGKFSATMAAKDGSAEFAFEGQYTQVIPQELLAYKMEDGRTVTVTFTKLSDTQTEVVETFDSEETHSMEQQKEGWQSILTSFKKHTENN